MDSATRDTAYTKEHGMEKLLDENSREELGKEVLELRQQIQKMKTCKETELKLTRSEERFRILFEYAPDGYFICNLKGIFIDGNIAAENIVGYTKEELIGSNFLKQGILPKKYLPKAMKNLAKNVIGKSTGPDEFMLNRKDGSTVWVEITTYPITLDGKRVVLGIARDITEKRILEERLLRDQKLDSLGTLAGGIAHDFNNILMGIAGNIGLARHRIDGESEAYDYLSIAEKAAIRGKALTQQLLTFSSGGAPVKKTVSVANEVAKAARFALSGSSVEAEFSFQDEECKADIDTGQFNQALCNIFINAKEAMKKEGTVRVGIEEIEVKEKNNTPFLPGNYVQISIRDQGGGISEGVISKIFDPFFSTKKGNKGMGLSVAYSIIKRHNGYLLVDSDPGRGTTFYILLPVSEKSIYTTKRYVSDGQQKTGKILVMDDEEVITAVAANILKEIGYTADTAADGQEAVEKYTQAMESGDPFDAAIMDLTVPGGMGGEEAVKKLLNIDPEAKVIVSSGYSNSPVFADYTRYGFKACMPKPYDIEELKHILKKVLSG